MEVAFADGRRDTESITLPLGHPRRPLSREQHLGKLQACLEPRLGVERAQRVIAVLERVDEARSIRSVIEELRAGS